MAKYFEAKVKQQASYRATAERDRATRRASAERRRAVSDRRAGARRAGALANAAPGVLSGVLSIAFCLIILVHLFGIITNGNDMTKWFDGDKSGVQAFHIVDENGAPLDKDKDGKADYTFFLFGAREESAAEKTGNEAQYSLSWIKPDHVSAEETVNWVVSLVGGIGDYAGNPMAGSRDAFWNFITGSFSNFLPNALGGVQDAVDGVVGDFMNWWNGLFGG